MLALGCPPFKNSSFFAATDTSSCRFQSSLDTLADEFRNYTAFSNCCYWVEQALLRLSSWPYHCPKCHRKREEGRKTHQKPAFYPWGVLGKVRNIKYMHRNCSIMMIKIYVHKCKITRIKMSYKIMGSVKWYVKWNGNFDSLEFSFSWYHKNKGNRSGWGRLQSMCFGIGSSGNDCLPCWTFYFNRVSPTYPDHPVSENCMCYFHTGHSEGLVVFSSVGLDISEMAGSTQLHTQLMAWSQAQLI